MSFERRMLTATTHNKSSHCHGSGSILVYGYLLCENTSHSERNAASAI